MNETVTYRPGTRLMNVGLFIAGFALLILIAVSVSGGTPTVYVVMGIIGGLVLAGIGFARRILFALESR